MQNDAEGLSDLAIANEEYMSISDMLEIAEALVKQTSDVLHKTALRTITDTCYRLLETGQVRLERARQAEKANLG
jgi:hypothetical protein